MITNSEKQTISEHYKILSQHFSDFKNRQSQRIMIAEIAKTLGNSIEITDNTNLPLREGESILVVEGPTGVGKSLAYLLAGTLLAQLRGKTLIISSATIALQQQLINKDIVLFEKASGIKLSYTLAKGRSHYLCPYRLYQLSQKSSQTSLTGFEKIRSDKNQLLPDEIKLLRNIADSFSDRQFLGDRDEWHESIPDALWLKINNEQHSCLKNDCPNRQECPFFLMREQLDKVDIIVVNHDLLLSDLEMGGGVILPAPQNCFYCIDEAHHLAKKAINHFAGQHKLSEARILIESLTSLNHKLMNIVETVAITEKLQAQLIELDMVFNDWENYLNQTQNAHFNPSHENIKTTWIWNGDATVNDTLLLVQNTYTVINLLAKNLTHLQDLLLKLKKEKAGKFDDLFEEFAWIETLAVKMNYVWQLLNKQPTAKEIPLAKWVVLNREAKLDYEFHVSPISAAEKLSHYLWKYCSGAILTSATLRSLNSFDLLLSQTGLDRFPKVTTLNLNSPFDFSRQAELYVPQLMSTPKEVAAHTEEIINWIPDLIDLTSPIGTLFLFASKKQMLAVYDKIPKAYQAAVLVQGLSAKNLLIESHIKCIAEKKASIIFGLDSFAEGLDLPGNLCVHVIIAKIPFAAPDNPVDKVYRDWIDSNGGNSFMQVTVPEASIKLSQAVGRLIRTETDYGRVTILDRRLLNQSYGKKLLANFPDFKRI